MNTAKARYRFDIATGSLKRFFGCKDSDDIELIHSKATISLKGMNGPADRIHQLTIDGSLSPSPYPTTSKITCWHAHRTSDKDIGLAHVEDSVKQTGEVNSLNTKDSKPRQLTQTCTRLFLAYVGSLLQARHVDLLYLDCFSGMML